ncbi:protein SIEVE ELEMENT OCCLUSION B-like [Nymphaea colorata]|nr:protein SIEVE ELEMENT OCCLUSION B-like [Nymphaea colorata]
MAPVKMPSLVKYNQPLFAASDDGTVMKNIQETHKPDGRMFDVKPVMIVVEQIFRQAAPAMLTTTSQAPAVAESKAHDDSMNLDALGGLSYTIHKIGCEITCKCSGGSDSHATTMALLSGTLSLYSWEGKAVLVLAAFAMSYGEFWLTGQLYAVNPLAKSVALLKQMPELLEHVDALKPKFDALNNLIKEMLELTRCIIEFSNLPVDYISMEAPAMVTALSHIPTAVYWIIKSAVTSSAQIIGLISMSHEYLVSTSEAWELSSLAHKVNNIHGHLKKQLEICLQTIDEKKSIEAYRILEQLIQTTHVDNVKIKRAFFPSKDDYPFIRGSVDKKVHVESLRRKIVLLLFSDLQITEEEHLTFLSALYQSHNSHGQENIFEVIWVPIVDPINDLNRGKQEAILKVAGEMPWLTAYPPPHPNSAFVKYARKEWRFNKKAILVALDGQGKVTNPNALYMINIWGGLAYPFSTEREEALWRAETWRLHFVVDDIDLVLSSWILEKRYICLYGGEDIDWIKSFTSKMKEIMKAAGVSIEMVYVGKAHPRAPTKKIIDTVLRERISASWPFESISFFWTRLDSMLHSRMQIQKGTEADRIQQEVITLLTYGNSARGWALLARGDLEMFVNEGRALIHVLDNYISWKDKIPEKGFNGAFQAGHDLHRTADHCVRLVLPSSSPVHQVTCPECRKHMERYLLFQCCDAQLVPDPAAAATANVATAAAGAATATAGAATATAAAASALQSGIPTRLIE